MLELLGKMVDRLPGYDTLNGFKSASGDQYAIDAKGSTIAIVAGGYNNKLQLWKSLDNGLTWTTKVIKTFPVPKYYGNVTLGDTYTTDGTCSVLIGKGDTVHVTTGIMKINDPDPNDENWNYYPATDSLVYWNDGRNTDDLLFVAKNNMFNGVNFHQYGRGITTYSTLAYDSITRTIYSVYSTIAVGSANENSNSLDYREIYVKSSSNNGLNWSEPVQLSNYGATSFSGNENMYPIVSKHFKNKLHLVWQQMKKPGTTNIDTSNWMYASFTRSDLQKIVTDSIYPKNNLTHIICNNKTNNFNVYYHAIGPFDPGNIFKIELSDSNQTFNNPVIIGQSNSTSISGSIIATISTVLPFKTHLIRITSTSPITKTTIIPLLVRGDDIRPISAHNFLYGQGFYLANAPFGICTGDSIMLRNNKSTVSCDWYKDEIPFPSSPEWGIRFLKTTVQGNYKVINFNGCNYDTSTVFIQVNQKPNTSLSINTSNAGCENENVTLIATPLPNVKYEWTNNSLLTDTTSFLKPLNAGVYNLKASSNVGCFVNNSKVVKISAGSNYNI
jgi:hypothetical protein